MNKKASSVLVNAGVLVLFIGAVFWLGDVDEYYRVIANANIFYFPGIAILYVVFYAVNGYVVNRLALNVFGVRLSVGEWFGLSVVNNLANLIFPFKTGTIFKALYLKKKYKFDISYSAGILAFSSFVSLFFILVLSTGLLVFFEFGSVSSVNAEWVADLPAGLVRSLLGVSFVLLFLALVFWSYVFWGEKIKLTFNVSKGIGGVVLRLRNSLFYLARSPILLFWLIFSTLINLLINVAIFWFAFSALGVAPDIFGLLCLNVLSTISFYISLSPGNIGVQELTISLSSLVLGISFEAGMVAAAIIRIVSTLATLFLGVVFCYRLGFFRILKGENNR